MRKQAKAKRIRVTRVEIAKAREGLLSVAEKVDTAKMDSTPTQPTDKGRWLGVVFCDSYGWAWMYIDGDNKCLGKTEEVITAIKKYKAIPEEPSEVKNAVMRFRAEFKSQSYHLRSENDASGMIGHGAKSHRITFKKDPRFLRLLDSLIEKGYGVPTIQRELSAKGYDVLYATLGRWIQKRK